MDDDNRLLIAREALRHTEVHLLELSQVANAADSRAMGTFAACGVIATILLTLASETPIPIINYMGALAVLYGGILAARTCSPRDFHIAGSRWECWKDHIVDGDHIYDVIVSQAEENDERIKANFASLKDNAVDFGNAQKIIWLATITTILVQSVVLAQKLESCS